MFKLKEIAKSYASRYVENAIMPLSVSDIAYSFGYGAMWGKSFLWNRVGKDRPTLKSPNRQIVIVLMLKKEVFDLDVILAEDYDNYITNKNSVGVPVLWCYMRDLLFKRIKAEKISQIEDEEFDNLDFSDEEDDD